MCQELWRDYATAISDHIRLDSKFRLATLEGDSVRTRLLSVQRDDAARERARIKDLITQHDARFHRTEAAQA